MSSARPDTWMPIYWGDYTRDTGHLNALAHGAYLMLIKHYWCTSAPLIDDDEELCRISCCDSISQWKTVRKKISRLFLVQDGMWMHKRVEHELAKSAAISNSKRQGGIARAQQVADERAAMTQQKGSRKAAYAEHDGSIPVSRKAAYAEHDGSIPVSRKAASRAVTVTVLPEGRFSEEDMKDGGEFLNGCST